MICLMNSWKIYMKSCNPNREKILLSNKGADTSDPPI